MYLHKQKKKNGDTYLSIKEKYHVPKVGSRETTVESIGYLSKLKNTPFLLRNLRFKNVKNFYQNQIMRSEQQIKISQGTGEEEYNQLHRKITAAMVCFFVKYG